MKQKQVLGIFALAIVAVLGVGMVSAFGGLGNGMSEQEKETLNNAMESGDYETWKEIKMSQISEERFQEIQERHSERAEFRAAMQEARESKDYSRVQELKAEFGKGKGMHNKNMNSGECPFTK